MNSTQTDRFLDVTELAGEEITQEQLERLCHRYYWAGGFCKDLDVLEVACGSGPGLRYLASIARSVQAGDYSPEVLARTRAHIGNDIELRIFDAQQLPYADNSLDIVIMFEALYYIPSAQKFVAEAHRVLRPGGKLLIVNSNKDIYDFNPSPFSTVYHGVVELTELLASAEFRPAFYGYLRLDRVSIRQRILRPIKKVAVTLNLIPDTMSGKIFLKRLVFGRMTRMPTAIVAGMTSYSPAEPIPAGVADRAHKIIYCLGEKACIDR